VGYLGTTWDSGSAVLIEGEGGECRAGGLLVGINYDVSFNTVTPVGLLVDSMAEELEVSGSGCLMFDGWLPWSCTF